MIKYTLMDVTTRAVHPGRDVPSYVRGRLHRKFIVLGLEVCILGYKPIFLRGASDPISVRIHDWHCTCRSMFKLDDVYVVHVHSLEVGNVERLLPARVWSGRCFLYFECSSARGGGLCR